MLSEPGATLLVTGGTGSIGFEIAKQAAEQGAIVAIHGTSAQSCADAINRLSALVPKGRFIAAPADFVADGAIAKMVDAVVAQTGRLDAVVNCAVSAPKGISGKFLQTDPASYGELTIHAIATLQWLCRATLPHLAKHKGAIVTVTSDAGIFAAPNQTLIGPTRAAIINFTRNLALEIGHDGVRINCISLSYVENTKIWDMVAASGKGREETARKRAGLGLPSPPDIAPAALFFCGPQSAKITGQTISINGGLNA